ncbi:MAG: chromate transporter [Proteobacteria bacterium]|nr:chromate transporter [Pseudomonadota bacterium]
MTSTVLTLLEIFARLSLLAFGGGNAVLPEMQRQVVEVHGWMTAHEFAQLYALAQAAPGPNMLVSTLIGWHVAGLGGALAATLGLTLPSCALTMAVASAWHRFRDAPWRRAVQAGLMPVTVGLIGAGALLLCQTTTTGWRAAALTAAATVLFAATKLHPLLILAAAAALGASGLLGG